MPDFKFSTDEETVDFDGVPVPESVRDKILYQGRQQTVNAIRRRAEEKLNGALGDDFDWEKAKPGEIVDSMASIFSSHATALEELKQKPPVKAPEKNDTAPVEASDEMRQLQDKIAKQEQDHKDSLSAEKTRNLTRESIGEVGRILVSAGLNEDQHEFIETMIEKCFDSKIEGDKAIYSQKGVDDDYYVNGQLAGAKDIAEFIIKKYINSFSTVAPGGGTRRTISGNPPPVSLYNAEKGGQLTRAEAEVWQ